MKQIFKEIREFKGKYQISTSGEVYSVKRKDSMGREYGGLFLKINKDKDGYSRVTLTGDNRKQYRRMIHKLVAIEFLDNPDNLPCVNHIDGNKNNNSIINLEWCTYKHNTQHGWKHGLCKTYDRNKPYNREGIINSNKKRARRVDCGL